MNFARSLLNLTLVAIGGILGNLLAGWLQQNVLGNEFTLVTMVLTVGGALLVLLILAGLDARNAGTGAAPDAAAPLANVERNRQWGKRNIIRVLTGTSAVGNSQLGSDNRIEVVDAGTPALTPTTSDRRASLQGQRNAKIQLLAILDEQLANFPHGAEPSEKLWQAQQLREDIRRIEDELDSLPPE